MKWLAGLFITAALTIIAGVTYWFSLAIGNAPTTWSSSDLVQFATYFGGVAGPLLALLTIAGLALALLMQNRQIEQVNEARIAEQHVRMLLEIGRDLEALEGQHLTADQTLRSILNGSSSLAQQSQEAFREVLRTYTEILGRYASGVALYRTNISPYFDCRVFEQRGLRLLDQVGPHVQYLDQMGRPTLALIRGHLENTLQVVRNPELCDVFFNGIGRMRSAASGAKRTLSKGQGAGPTKVGRFRGNVEWEILVSTNHIEVVRP